VADALVTNFFYCFRVLQELHSDQDWNFESRLMQEVLWHLRVSKIDYPSSNGMVERYVKMDEEHVRKVTSTHQRHWEERLLIFPQAYRASTYETMGTTPASMVFGRELHLPCDLLFEAFLNKKQSSTDLADLTHQPHNIHYYAC
jgi:transposase InsO family protein